MTVADLHTSYLGLDLHSPLVVSASPLTGSLDGLRRLEGGAGSLSAALALDDYNAGPFGYLALVEKRYLELVRSVRQTVGIPLAVKLSPYVSSVANLARQLVESGVDGLVLFNRFYQPDLDLDSLEVPPAWSCRPPRSCGCRCAGWPSSTGRSRPHWPPRPGCTPPPTPSRSSWPGRTWP